MHYEAGQLLHNNPVGLESPDFVDALMFSLRREISRVYWNVHQTFFYDDADLEYGDKHGDPPLGIPNMEWRTYYNWGGSPEDEDWNQNEANAPNFSFEGVEVRWYKRFGRSMNVNVCWSPEKWVRWFERARQTLRAWETEHDRLHGGGLGDPVPYPDPKGVVSLTPEPEDLRHVELEQKVFTLEAQLNMIACVCLKVERGEQPDVSPKDWRYCHDLEWVVKLGKHALTAPTPFKLHDEEQDGTTT